MKHTLHALALAALAAAGCASTQPHVHGNPPPETKVHWTIAVPSSLRAHQPFVEMFSAVSLAMPLKVGAFLLGFL